MPRRGAPRRRAFNALPLIVSIFGPRHKGVVLVCSITIAAYAASVTNDSGPEPPLGADDETPDPARTYLWTAASLVLLEGLALLVLAVAELTSVSAERVGLGVSTAVFFLVLGGGLCAAAYGLVRRVSWSRGPVVFAQLIQLGMAWSLRDVAPLAVVMALAVVALAVLGCIVAPATTASLADDPRGRPDEPQ